MKTVNKLKIIQASNISQFVRFVNNYIKNRKVTHFVYSETKTDLSVFHTAAIITTEKA